MVSLDVVEQNGPATPRWTARPCTFDKGLGVVLAFLGGGGFACFHENARRYAPAKVNDVWDQIASPWQLSVYCITCVITTLICLIRPGPSMWPILRNCQVKSLSQWLFLALGPCLLMANIVTIRSIDSIGLSMTEMVLGICLPFMGLVCDLLSSFQIVSPRQVAGRCEVTRSLPRYLDVPDKYEALRAFVGCVLAATTASVFFFCRTKADEWWLPLIGAITFSLFFYCATHVYYKFQRAPRISCVALWLALLIYAIICVSVWNSREHEPFFPEGAGGPYIAGTLLLGALWLTLALLGSVFAVFKIRIAETMTCWVLGFCALEVATSGTLFNSQNILIQKDEIVVWSAVRFTMAAICFAALFAYVAAVSADLNIIKTARSMLLRTERLPSTSTNL
eukprot:Blabericola_migrator_1__1420@NODE_1372_length_4700_cov_152_201381_g921_i0_p2_GENE_NODE_1372_length_4700_cov_152_201381_g921_i0NODE_1372_length_4700_cov_152_201381_g921_i0_p2_ORF_typecomplete_len394_score28_20DUF4501/PF14946_6/0_14_NODE_1372_length_4700_cov_152_201381_g921_i029194100